MCGICGVLFEKHNDFPIGSILQKMMASQQIRAQDSTGVAIFSHDDDNNNNNNSRSRCSSRLGYFIENQGMYESREEEVPAEGLEKLLGDLADNPHITIASLSSDMKLVKNVGLARDLDSRYKVKSMRGSHGIGHLRIATSSRVTPYNAHPFSTTVLPDIAVVHNGEITNYSKLRNALELEGYPFYTNCDSEVIAVFIADQLLKHGDIEKAHYEFVKRADGPFTYIAATPISMSLVRDRFGSRKGIVGYNPGDKDYPAFWAMATDLSALDLVGATDCIETPQPGKPRIFFYR
jgi:glucosamine 6-phosphate synthetase-like amidotransferase/phosphosugar isomerase protein